MSGLRVVPVHVPAFARGEAVLLPPLFPEPASRWLLVQEEPRGEEKRPAYPFLLRNEPFVPAALPVLTPGREVRLVIAGFNLGAGPWKAQAQVLTAEEKGIEGKEIPGGSLELIDQRAGGAIGADRILATYRPPADLKPGVYVLKVTVPGAPEAGGSLRFLVGPRARG
jgi:hypothetical protein